jgi:hypothetical protein
MADATGLEQHCNKKHKGMLVLGKNQNFKKALASNLLRKYRNNVQ